MKNHIFSFMCASIVPLVLGCSIVHAASIQAIVSSNNSGQFCHFQLSDITTANTGCYGPNNGFISDTPTIEPTDTWRHITMTIGSGSAKIYIDGALTQSNSITTDNITTSSAVSIARGFLGSRYFLGLLDEVAIYDSVLSDDRVLSHYNASFGGYGDYVTEVFADDPIGYWQLNEVSGSIAIDSSGNVRHGTYFGGVTLGTPSAFASGNIASATFDGSSGYISLPGSWGGTPEVTIEAWANTSVVPVPAAVWLFGSGLLGLLGIARKKAA